jgi:hypothetical protein
MLKKAHRIIAMFKELLAGEQYVHPNVRTIVFNQISQYSVLRRDNTDGILDLLTYAPKVIQEYGVQIVSRGILGNIDANSNIDVDNPNSAF